MSEPLSMRLKNQMQIEMQRNSNFSESESDSDVESIDGYLTRNNEVNYEMISGLRENSEILWDAEEHQLYYYNASKSVNSAFTCCVKACKARIFVRPDGTAFRNEKSVHSTHGRQYEKYKLMYCHNRLKDKVLSSPSSKKLKDIYNEVVGE